MMRGKFFGAFLGGVAYFCFAVAVGYYFGAKSWNGSIYIAENQLSSNPRQPAAIKREFDFSRLDGAEFITATQKRLITAAKVIEELDTTGKIGIELGHFVVKDKEGQRRLACDALYDRIQLRFEAEGVAEAGEVAVMEIDGPCKSSEANIASIEPIWIPVAKIVAEEPVDMDLSYEDGVKFRFTNLVSSWPKRWNLNSVRLYNSMAASNEVTISDFELREIRERPVVLKWLMGRVPAKEE